MFQPKAWHVCRHAAGAGTPQQIQVRPNQLWAVCSVYTPQASKGDSVYKVITHTCSDTMTQTRQLLQPSRTLIHTREPPYHYGDSD